MSRASELKFEIEEEWDEPLELPQFKQRKKQQAWKDEVYLWEEGKKIYISGGAKIYYWCLEVLFEGDEKKYENDCIKLKHYGKLREAYKIMKREKQLGYKIKATNTAKGLRNFEQVEFVAEQLKSLGEKA